MCTEKRICRLTQDGLIAWAKHHIEVDPRQVFTIEYENSEYIWVKVWWGETAVILPSMIIEVS